jgi:hypothetical protein
MQEQFYPIDMGILIQMIYAPGIECRGAANDPMDLISFFEKELRQIRTILPRDAGDERFFQ